TATGHLTAGVLELQGNLTAAGTALANFAPSGTHLTRFTGVNPQTINFVFPGATQQRFQDVEIAKLNGAVSMASNLVANGQLRSSVDVTPVLAGGGRTLAVGGVDVDNLVLDNVLLTIGGGVITRFDYVTFQNYA